MILGLRVSIAGAVAVSFIVLSGSSLGTAPSRQAASTIEPESVRAVLTEYCLECHNDRLKTAALALDTFDLTKIAANPEVWEKVVKKLRGRMMPPLGRRRPDDNTYNSVVAYLEKSLDMAAASIPIRAGPTPSAG